VIAVALRWYLRFIDAARPAGHASGDRWFVDETYVKVAGRWIYLYRAVDQYGQVIDVRMPRGFGDVWRVIFVIPTRPASGCWWIRSGFEL
jgi:hypothetical protein